MGLEDQNLDEQVDGQNNSPLTYQELQAVFDSFRVTGPPDQRQKIIADLLEHMESLEDRLKCSFTTENGSRYFVLETGQCMRIKKHKNGKFEVGGPITEKIYFMTPEQGKKAFDLARVRSSWHPDSLENITPEYRDDLSIQVSHEPKVGLHPFEYNLSRNKSGLIIEEDRDRIRITGATDNNGVKLDDPENLENPWDGYEGVYHWGHPITSIEKGSDPIESTRDKTSRTLKVA